MAALSGSLKIAPFSTKCIGVPWFMDSSPTCQLTAQKVNLPTSQLTESKVIAAFQIFVNFASMHLPRKFVIPNLILSSVFGDIIFYGDVSLILSSRSTVLMLHSIGLVNSWSRVHERWNSVPFILWTRALVITSGELELGSCTASSPLVIKDGGGSWYGRWIFGCKSIFLQYFDRIQQCFGSLTILDCHYRT